MSQLDRIGSAKVAEFLNVEETLTTVMGKIRLAIPSMWPGGIESLRSEHWGSCDCFTLVDIDKGKVKDIKVVPNTLHSQGDDLAQVDLLLWLGANILIASSIDTRPLVGLREAGMEVYRGIGASVSDVILEFICEALTPMYPHQACGGH